MNILLLEPDYQSKFPPIGLMKLAYYHKEIRGDSVWFAKGKVPNKLSDAVKEKIKNSKYYKNKYSDIDDYFAETEQMLTEKRWDRVYVTTLFTFEWERTIKTIEYAKKLTSPDHVFVGGILATLMPDELEAATGIKPMTGLLTDTAAIGFDDKVNLDILTPDYSILDNVEHYYPLSEHYITNATRGCGMKCSFCAVQKLEPECVSYIPIQEKVKEIDDKYGERKNLILMDNNILKTRHLERIVEDIIGLGYGAGATKTNPRTGKKIRVYVDLNQGLDMNFVTDKKMELLSRLSLRPIRIAFDHINDKEKYIKAMRLADKHKMSEMSNYMLYNTPDFRGKGIEKTADTPKDLYERCRINVELEEEFNERRRCEGLPLAHIYSFPMRFIPLGNKTRAFVGTNWSKKMLRNFQLLVYCTSGVVYATKDSFYKIFGADYKEFELILQAPGIYIKKRTNKKTQLWHRLFNVWKRLFTSLSQEEQTSFISLIQNNQYSYDEYIKISTYNMRMLYLHYFEGLGFLEFIKTLRNHDLDLFSEVQQYITKNCLDTLRSNIEILNTRTNAEENISLLIFLLFNDSYQDIA